MFLAHLWVILVKLKIWIRSFKKYRFLNYCSYLDKNLHIECIHSIFASTVASPKNSINGKGVEKKKKTTKQWKFGKNLP